MCFPRLGRATSLGTIHDQSSLLYVCKLVLLIVPGSFDVHIIFVLRREDNHFTRALYLAIVIIG